MMSDYSPFDERGRTRQHVGGYFVPSYEGSYVQLTQERLGYVAPAWTSLVAHHAVVYKPYMRELLQRFQQGGRSAQVALSLNEVSALTNEWVWEILRTLPADEGMLKGFSEYGSYGTWVATHHRSSVNILPQKRWSRFPPLSLFPFNAASCCPTDKKLEQLRQVAKDTQLEYVGWELGHIPWCSTKLSQASASESTSSASEIGDAALTHSKEEASDQKESKANSHGHAERRDAQVVPNQPDLHAFPLMKSDGSKANRQRAHDLAASLPAPT